MPPEDNRALALRMYELFEGDDLGAFDELVAQDIVDHNPFPGQPDGLEGMKFLTRIFRFENGKAVEHWGLFDQMT